MRRLLRALLPVVALGCALDSKGQDSSAGDPGGGSDSNGAGAVGNGAGGSTSGGAGGTTGAGAASSSSTGTGNTGGEPASCGAGSVCIPTAPAGWEGHFHIRRTAYPDAAPPPCPDGTTAALSTDGPAGPAQCSACTCGALQGGECAVNVTYWLSSNCSGSVSSESYLLDVGYACYHWPNTFSGLLSGKLDGYVVLEQGSCAAAGGQIQNPSPWQNQDAICPATTAAGSCADGEVCLGSGNGDYAGLCIRQTGSVACPPGWGEPIHTFGSFTDDRDCGGCSCAPSPKCSGGTVTLFDGDGCSGVSTTLTTQCQDLDDYIDGGSGSETASPPTPGGSCTPGGGAAAGALVPSEPMTYCCK